MRTIGVDLSAEETNTWMATIDWKSGAAQVVALEPKVSNKQIVEAGVHASPVGIDCPFGWPLPFLHFVQEHMVGNVSIRDGLPIEWRRDLAYRTTDRFVTARTGLRPLSVAADRIAHAAMRCSALLSAMNAAGIVVDRSGVRGSVFEVYPAAALKIWDLAHRGYKRTANLDSLDSLVTALLTRAPWLQLGEHETNCRRIDDALDAVIAALNARAVALGLTLRPPAPELHTAQREGWIALPRTGTLPMLASA